MSAHQQGLEVVGPSMRIQSIPRSQTVPQHRLGLSGIGSSPIEQGLESTPAELQRFPAPQINPGGEKEVNGDSVESNTNRAIDLNGFSKSYHPKDMWRLWLALAVVALLILMVIAVTVPLELLQTNRDSIGKNLPSNSQTNASNSQPSNFGPTSSSSPAFQAQNFSLSGAFDGTGLATFNTKFNEILTTEIFYQDYKGHIRRVEKRGSQWSGGPNFPIVTSNAKNATPLACVNYTDTTTNTPVAHLFYVDSSNLLNELISIDNLKTWQNGAMRNGSFETSASAVALTALYNDRTALRLYYGAPDNLVHELVFSLGVSSWSSRCTFLDTNGNGGITSISVDESTDNVIARLYALDMDNNIREWNLTITGVSDSSWVQEPTSAPVVASVNSSLAYGYTFLCFQEPSKAITALQVNQFGIPWNSVMSIGGNSAEYALANSAIAAGAVYVGGEFPDSLDIWYQPNASIIMECLDLVGQYNLTQLPI